MFVLPLSRSAHRPVSPQFSRVIDRLFDESFDHSLRGATAGAQARTPALDVSETETAYDVVFDVPGVTREQIKVSVEGRRVSIETVDLRKAEPVEGAAAEAHKDAARALYRERSSARYARTVSLPAEVDQTASQAKFENGVLTLTLAKKVATGATQLKIN
ncbi:MAG: Hsp20/alpha crystallin family protein [Burkholderiales bacterium]|nr:Hsp20/alpha crystallin family protein [Burkholderiales bacterium]